MTELKEGDMPVEMDPEDLAAAVEEMTNIAKFAFQAGVAAGHEQGFREGQSVHSGFSAEVVANFVFGSVVVAIIVTAGVIVSGWYLFGSAVSCKL